MPANDWNPHQLEPIKKSNEPIRIDGARSRLTDLNFVAECRTAREASVNLGQYQPDAKAWVYVFQYPGRPGHFGTRFSIRPEATLFDEPGARLTPVAAFKDGKCVMSIKPQIIEPEGLA